MTHMHETKEIKMADHVEIPWGRFAALAGGVVALTLLARCASTLVRIALDEVDYRIVDPQAWARWLR
jgi:hypothetical protein